MRFGFDDDQEALRATAARVLAAECPPSVARAAMDDPEAWRSLWKTLVEMGWTGLTVPERLGGLGRGTVDLVALLELTGAAVLPAPLLSTVGLAGPVLAAGGDPAAEALGRIAAGAVAALVVQDRDLGDHDPAGAASWDGRRLRGKARLVPDGVRADLLVVLARDTDGVPVAALVEAGAHARVTPTWSVDPNRPLADVELDVPASDAVVLDGDPLPALDVALTALAAELVGVAQRVVDLSVAHATGRRQFDRPIGAFQAVKHRLADAHVAVERARTLTYHAAMVLDDPTAPGSRRSLAAALAKAAASEAGVAVAKHGVQVHGAIALTWEHDLHLYLRRARQAAMCLGDHRANYRRTASLYLEGAR